jgi:hypothetical protein
MHLTGTGRGRAFAARCDRTIRDTQQLHRARKPAEPHQRRSPPDFMRQRYDGIRATVLLSVFGEQADLMQQFARRQSEKARNA